MWDSHLQSSNTIPCAHPACAPPAGVLIDDLTTLGTKEPYRMFTSRAEYRLSLRAENADQRLTERGAAAGVVSLARAEMARERGRLVQAGIDRMTSFKLPAAAWRDRGSVKGKAA